MIQVGINGVILMPGHDYHIEKDQIVFSQAPRMGDNIQIVSKAYRHSLHGNDVSYKYDIPNEMKKAHKIEQLIEDLVEYMDHPSVQDQLDRLQVIIELVRKTDKTSLTQG